MDRIYIDIETIPRPYTEAELDELLDASVPKTHKKPDTIAAWKADNRDAVAAKSSLDPNAGIIACIGFAVNDGNPMIVMNSTSDRAGELEMLARLSELLGQFTLSLIGAEWVAHNGLSFDFPYLWRRAVKYGISELAVALPHLRNDKSAVDTMLLWAGTDYRDMTSLSDICEFLDIDVPVTIDGSEVAWAWINDRRKVTEHCEADVIALREVHRRIVGNFERHPMRAPNDQTV